MSVPHKNTVRLTDFSDHYGVTLSQSFETLSGVFDIRVILDVFLQGWHSDVPPLPSELIQYLIQK